MTDEKHRADVDSGLANVVQQTALEARTREIKHVREQSSISKPAGATAAERNSARVDTILNGVLPANFATSVQRNLDRALEVLGREHPISTHRALLDEYRNPHRFGTTPLSSAARAALDTLVDIAVSIAEPENEEQAESMRALGIDIESAFMGKSAAQMQRGRKEGGRSAGEQRAAAAERRHAAWREKERLLLAAGHSKREVAGIIARTALAEGADIGTIRRALRAKTKAA